jgi:hypothetical protein
LSIGAPFQLIFWLAKIKCNICLLVQYLVYKHVHFNIKFIYYDIFMWRIRKTLKCRLVN